MPPAKKPSSFKRDDFIQKFIAAGLTYPQAQTAYVTMVHSLETAVIKHRKIILGDLGVMTPKLMRPRRVIMSCRGGRIGAAESQKEYFLGARTKYRFTMHETFGQKHGFNT